MSYMSNKSILSEGVLDYIVKKYFLPKALKKDKEYQRLAKKADKALKDFQDAVNAELKRLETNKKVDVEGLIFRSNEFDKKVVLEVEESEIVRLKANLPAKIFSEKKKNPKKIQLEFYFDNFEFINQWLLQFGLAVKVLGPEDLIEKRKTLLKEMLSR